MGRSCEGGLSHQEKLSIARPSQALEEIYRVGIEPCFGKMGCRLQCVIGVLEAEVGGGFHIWNRSRIWAYCPRVRRKGLGIIAWTDWRRSSVHHHEAMKCAGRFIPQAVTTPDCQKNNEIPRSDASMFSRPGPTSCSWFVGSHSQRLPRLGAVYTHFKLLGSERSALFFFFFLFGRIDLIGLISRLVNASRNTFEHCHPHPHTTWQAR